MTTKLPLVIKIAYLFFLKSNIQNKIIRWVNRRLSDEGDDYSPDDKQLFIQYIERMSRGIFK